MPGRGADKQDCLAARVLARWPDARVVHRLDMATSGLMLFARGADMQRRLSCDFAARHIDKHYVALVDGRIAADSGRIDLPLAADWPNRPRQQVDAARGKPSLTHWQVLQRAAAAHAAWRCSRSPAARTSCACTWRPSAIRSSAMRCTATLRRSASPRLMLHAAALQLDHPLHGTRLELHCAPPF